MLHSNNHVLPKYKLAKPVTLCYIYLAGFLLSCVLLNLYIFLYERHTPLARQLQNCSIKNMLYQVHVKNDALFYMIIHVSLSISMYTFFSGNILLVLIYIFPSINPSIKCFLYMFQKYTFVLLFRPYLSIEFLH